MIKAIFILFLTVSVSATDLKTCVLDKIKKDLNAKDTCAPEKLKGLVGNVPMVYQECTLAVLDAGKAISYPEMQTLSNTNHDSEIEKLFNDKISSCQLKGQTKISKRGMKRSIEFFDSQSPNGDRSGSPLAK